MELDQTYTKLTTKDLCVMVSSQKRHHENNPFEFLKALDHWWTALGMEYHGEWPPHNQGSVGVVLRWVWRDCQSWRVLECHGVNLTVGGSVVPDARLNDLELKSTLVGGGQGGLFPWVASLAGTRSRCVYTETKREVPDGCGRYVIRDCVCRTYRAPPASARP